MTHHEDPSDLFSAQTPGQAPVPDDTSNEAASHDAPTESLGSRLRAARKAQGLSLADCAGTLHLPVKVLQRLEADEFGEPKHFVYLRGVLSGYARLLGLPDDTCDEALREFAPAEQPALVAVARTSPARWLLQRYGTAATYIVLTATIAVPLVLLGLRGGLERPSTRVVSLDQAATLASPHGQADSTRAAAKSSAKASPDSSPFRASMTPFAAIGLRDIGMPAVHVTTTPVIPVSAPATSPVVSGSGPHKLKLVASADCWFEITDAAGNRVDSGTLHAGDVHSWHASGPLHVTLGNAAGVAVTEDGKPVQLKLSSYSKVARLDLFQPAAADSGEND